jgi:hypothetical protein
MFCPAGKPHVDTADTALHTESNHCIPPIRKKNAHTTIANKYRPTHLEAICEMCGKNFSPFSEDSLRNKDIPPMRKIGKMTMPIKTIPIPPTKLKMNLQIAISIGMVDWLFKTEKPVVVSAEVASNQESMNDKWNVL